MATKKARKRPAGKKADAAEDVLKWLGSVLADAPRILAWYQAVMAEQRRTPIRKL